MWFMRFAIDAVFLDRESRVLRIAEHLKPWRLAGCRGASAVVELAGECERSASSRATSSSSGPRKRTAARRRLRSRGASTPGRCGRGGRRDRQVVDLGAEARLRDAAALDALTVEPVDLGLDVVPGKLEPGGAADFPPPLRIPGEDEKRLALEDEERTVGVLALVVGGGRPARERVYQSIERSRSVT